MTHRRYLLLLLLFFHTVHTFMDRTCISAASKDIMFDLRLSEQTMGYILAVFPISYALFQIPSGWLADVFGPKKALLVVVSFWSTFTALTGAAWNFVSLLVVRFFFGAGEAGAFPGAARALYNWLPARERGLANGIFQSGGRVGAALSFFIMPPLIHVMGWRWTFVINGAAGGIWAAVWFFWFRDHPRDHPAVGAAEREYIQQGIEEEDASGGEQASYGDTVLSANMLLAMFQYVASNMTLFISVSWLFPYVVSRWGTGAVKYTPIPLLVGACAHWLSGGMVTALHRRGFHAASARIPAMLGFALGAIGLLLCTQVATASAPAFIVCFSIALFGVEMTIAPSWTFCIDLGGKKSGAISATMNMFGNFGSAASAVLFPYFRQHVTLPFFAPATGSGNSFFVLAAGLNAMAIIAWMGMNSARHAARFPVIPLHPGDDHARKVV
jgi:ACS family glucarate transporter-like MFS transporter